MLKSYLLALLASAAVLLVPGCGESPPTITPAAGPAPIASLPAAPIDVDDNQRAEAARALREAMANYVAPFPERTDLFVPPKDAPAATSGPLAEGDVQLRGLVNVGEPQVILDIEGATALVAVGGEKFGVKVLSIDHQKVVLERGPTRWTASLD